VRRCRPAAARASFSRSAGNSEARIA
jgi:hypothetical protein